MAIFEKFAPLNRFLIATNRVFLSDLSCSFFSSLYRTKPRALWSYLRESIFDLFFAAAPTNIPPKKLLIYRIASNWSI